MIGVEYQTQRHGPNNQYTTKTDDKQLHTLVVEVESCYFVSPKQIENMYQIHECEPETTST